MKTRLSWQSTLLFVAACSGGSGTPPVAIPDAVVATIDLAVSPVDDLGAATADLTVVAVADLTAQSPDFAKAPPDLAMSPPDLVIPPYPAGPYGNKVGDTFPPLVWEGYADLAADAVANTKPYGAYTMNDIHKGSAPYALIHVSDFF